MITDWTQYLYEARVVGVYDADTMDLCVDLGFNIAVTHRVRLYGIDAWEVRGVERRRGRIARDWLREQIPVGSTVRVETIQDKQGKYGRYLAVVYDQCEQGEWRNLNQALVENGHAEHRWY